MSKNKGQHLENESHGKVLSAIERIGNSMPHPIVLFLVLCAIVIVLSFILNITGVTAVNPSTGETMTVINLLSIDGLSDFMLSFVSNFQKFPILGIVLLMATGTAICEQSGFFEVALRSGMKNIKGNAVVVLIAAIGVISNNFGDASFIIVPSLAAIIFMAMGRHPLAGVFLGYASVGGGYSTELIPSLWDVELTPVAVAAAQTMEPGFEMNPLSGFLFLFIAAILVIIISSVVTVKYIEPRLGKYEGDGLELGNHEYQPTDLEKRALKAVIRNVLIYLALIVVACIPANSFMRNAETGSLLINSGLMNSMSFLLVALFYVAGFTFAIVSKKWKSVDDAVAMAEEGIKSMATFVVMAIVIGQFMYFLSRSNLAAVVAVNAGNAIAGLGLPGWLICVIFLFLVGVTEFLIPSGNSKWMLLCPIFVPLMMQLNIHPSFTQAVYRLGDCVTQHMTPMFAFFIILLSIAQKYDKKAGVGTVFAAMTPYGIAYFIAFAIEVIIWVVFDLPVGFGGQVFMH